MAGRKARRCPTALMRLGRDARLLAAPPACSLYRLRPRSMRSPRTARQALWPSLPKLPTISTTFSPSRRMLRTTSRQIRSARRSVSPRRSGSALWSANPAPAPRSAEHYVSRQWGPQRRGVENVLHRELRGAALSVLAALLPGRPVEAEASACCRWSALHLRTSIAAAAERPVRDGGHQRGTAACSPPTTDHQPPTVAGWRTGWVDAVATVRCLRRHVATLGGTHSPRAGHQHPASDHWFRPCPARCSRRDSAAPTTPRKRPLRRPRRRRMPQPP